MTHAWIDGHLDLACMAVEGRDIHAPCPDPVAACISLPDLACSPIQVIFGTIFTAPAQDPGSRAGYEYVDVETAHAAGVMQLEIYQQLEESGHLAMQHEGLRMPAADEPPGLLLLMEGADPIRNPDEVAWWRARGLRIVGLTWSTGTRYAGGNACETGLTDAGRDLVAAMDESGIVHDASHCSDASMDDLLGCAQGTIIASHSNSRAINGIDIQRHLRDDHAIEILQRGGIIGLNLFSKFLVKEGRATIDDCVEHVMHYCQLAGNKRQVALGSDYDGGFTPAELPLGLEHPCDLGKLLAALSEAGFNEDELAGFAHANWMKLLG